MSTFWCKFCVWATAIVATLATDPPLPGDDGYCVPEAWQGGRAVTTGVVTPGTGKSSVTRNLGIVYYSAKLQKMMIYNNLYAANDAPVQQLFDYPAHTLYTVTGFDPTTCTKTSLPGPFKPQCVPANANVTMYKSFYGVGQNSQYAMELSGIQAGVYYRVSMTNDYVPIFEELWGTKNGDNFFQSLSFYNMSVYDVPDVVFKPPSECDHVTLGQVSARSSGDDAMTSHSLFLL